MAPCPYFPRETCQTVSSTSLKGYNTKHASIAGNQFKHSNIRGNWMKWPLLFLPLTWSNMFKDISVTKQKRTIKKKGNTSTSGSGKWFSLCQVFRFLSPRQCGLAEIYWQCSAQSQEQRLSLSLCGDKLQRCSSYLLCVCVCVHCKWEKEGEARISSHAFPQ